MGNAFKLSVHLEHIIKDIVKKQKVHYTEEVFRENIFTFLDTIYDNGGEFNLTEATKLMRGGFKHQLIEEVMCQMSDDEDYLTSTINKKINTLSKHYMREWITKKISK
jgi:hypothetical protein